MLSRSSLFVSALLVTTLAVLPRSAVAQQAGQDAPATLPAPRATPAPSQVQGPPDGLIAPPAGGQPPAPVVQPTPQPSTPAVSPQTVTPTPSPPPQRRADAPRTAPSTSAPRPPAPAPSGPRSAEPAKVEDAGQRPDPALTEPSAPPDTPSIAPAAVPDATMTDGGLPEWAPLALVLVTLGALIAGLFVLRRRRAAHSAAADGDHAVPAHNQPAAVAPSGEAERLPQQPKARPAPAAPPAKLAVTGNRAELAVGFEPLSASSTLVNFRLRYAVTLTNSGTMDACDIGVRLGVFAGTTANPFGISQWYLDARDQPHQTIARIPAGESHRFEGEVAAPIDALAPVPVEGRRIAVPLIAVDARYHHAAGESPIDAQTARAFVVGREKAERDGKLAPFRLDLGPMDFDALGQRDSGVSQSS